MLALFAALDARHQSAFLDALNVYLYSSPQQRRRLALLWSSSLAQLEGDAHARGEASNDPHE